MSKDTRETYRHISTATPPPPPLEIQVLLSVPDLSHNRVLVLSPSHPLNPGFAPSSPTTPSQRILISPTPKYVLLESDITMLEAGEEDTAPARVGRERVGIVVRIKPAERDIGVLGFDSAPCPDYAPLETQLQRFPPIPHPLGRLTVEVRCLTETAFSLDDLESLLSSGFAAMDRIAPRGFIERNREEEEPFVPTLLRQQQRESVGSLVSQRTGGSLVSQRSGLSGGTGDRDRERGDRERERGEREKMDNASIAERFVLPSRTGGWKSDSPSTATTAVPGSQAARLRKESLGGSGVSLASSTGSGGDSTASPLSIRRPPIHPFKSSTLVSTGSPGALARMQGSPKVPVPSVPGISGSPVGKLSSSPGITRISSSPGAGPAGRTRIVPSPVSGQFPFGSVNKPSPPFSSSSPADHASLQERERDRERAPSRTSLLDRPPSSIGSNSDRNRRLSTTSERDRRVSLTSDPGNPQRKYTSPFVHRYTGSTGSQPGVGLASIPATPGVGERSPSPVVPGSPAPGSPLVSGSRLGSPTGGRSPIVGSPLVAGRNLGASGGSGGSGGGVGGDNKGSYLSQTDDDDISAFVQHIDSRKPLSGRVKQHNQSQQQVDDDTIRASGRGKEKERADTAFSGSSPATTSAATATITARPSRPSPLSPFPTSSQPREREQTVAEPSTSPTSGGLMLTRQDEVEEKLKKMNEAFMKTLEGISGSTRRRNTAPRERARVDRDSSLPPAPEPAFEEGGTGSGGSGGDNTTAYPARRYPHYFNQFQESVGSFASQGSEEVIGKMELDEAGAGRGRRR
ncbi:hypothetical protein BDQ17DRAFT_1430860 [Cyathus striatus]|nr:hypothetical protein BDQ17DRAFT_1430860 [Cyathus striatus]